MTFELKGGHVLAAMLVFFGITVAVNVLMTTYAISTFSGEDVSKPYLKGLEYNKTLNARAAQAALAWTAEIEAARVASDIVVTARILGRDHAARHGLEAQAELRRPTDARLDRQLTLEADGAGAYQATAKDVAAGQWDVIVRTTAENGAVFEAERRVVLK